MCTFSIHWVMSGRRRVLLDALRDRLDGTPTGVRTTLLAAISRHSSGSSAGFIFDAGDFVCIGIGRDHPDRQEISDLLEHHQAIVVGGPLPREVNDVLEHHLAEDELVRGDFQLLPPYTRGDFQILPPYTWRGGLTSMLSISELPQSLPSIPSAPSPLFDPWLNGIRAAQRHALCTLNRGGRLYTARAATTRKPR